MDSSRSGLLVAAFSEFLVAPLPVFLRFVLDAGAVSFRLRFLCEAGTVKKDDMVVFSPRREMCGAGSFPVDIPLHSRCQNFEYSFDIWSVHTKSWRTAVQSSARLKLLQPCRHRAPTRSSLLPISPVIHPTELHNQRPASCEYVSSYHPVKLTKLPGRYYLVSLARTSPLWRLPRLR